jgi:hypothetical protein
MIDAVEENIKDRIWMSMMAYSILKEVLKYDECGCGWSRGLRPPGTFRVSCTVCRIEINPGEI